MTFQLPPLPEMLRVACRVGGMEAVRALSEAFGGRQIKIPKRCGDDHPLVKAGGRAVADALCAQWGGEQLDFPRGGAALRMWVGATLLSEGKTLNDLVTELRISHRWAKKIKAAVERGTGSAPSKMGRKRAPGDPRQIDIEDLCFPKK